MSKTNPQCPTLGLVLGSGSARGWAHIGVIRALAEEGIEPDVVCGTSVGALVGAAYVSGNLDVLEAWIRGLSFWDVMRLMDVRLSGGLIEGESLMSAFQDKFRDIAIEALPKPFGAVSCDLLNGQERWLQSGSLHHAVRASIALPGLFSPFRKDGRWMVDGGLVNPVPISLCRAMGAEVIIAVNLNGGIVGKHMTSREPVATEEELTERDLFSQLLEKLNHGRREKTPAIARRRQGEKIPGMFEVIATAINIMQDRITRSRMAGDPPDVLIAPRLSHLGLLEFDRAEEAINEGFKSTHYMLPAIRELLRG